MGSFPETSNDPILMSQCSLPDHAGFRHKIFNSYPTFFTPKLSADQGYLRMMDGVLYSSTNPSQGGSSLKTIVLPTSLTLIRL